MYFRQYDVNDINQNQNFVWISDWTFEKQQFQCRYFRHTRQYHLYRRHDRRSKYPVLYLLLKQIYGLLLFFYPFIYSLFIRSISVSVSARFCILTESDFAKDKLFLRMVQNKLSISEDQNDNSKINNLDTRIQPQMKKSYKKFIKSLSNEEIKSFRLNEVTQNFVDYLPIEKLADLDVTGNNLSKAIQDKLKRKKNRIEWWVKFWNHVPLIGYLYRKSKQSLLNNINSKLPSIPESYGLISELNKTRAKINNTKVDNEDKTNTNTKKENDNYETNITNSSQEK